MPEKQPTAASRRGRPPSRPIATGLFAFEGNWEADLSDRASIATLLQTLQECVSIDFIRRDIGTEEELRHYIDRWLDDYDHYQIGYFGFHGTAGNLWLDDNRRVRLGDLEEMIDGRARGRVIHFSSCSVMRAAPDRIAEFRKRTGARAVTGYRKDVDNIEAFSFELLLIQSFSAYRQVSGPDNYLWERASGLYEHLGFEFRR
ncbi:DUF6642 family protein [Candidatus Poriferisodalis sp.]|uniref:DUF6642 family protein n=1 Tax=Candidatus Poriferisodalis sp. TaxID=3101277 RepID=UPI003B0249A0